MKLFPERLLPQLHDPYQTQKYANLPLPDQKKAQDEGIASSLAFIRSCEFSRNDERMEDGKRGMWLKTRGWVK